MLSPPPNLTINDVLNYNNQKSTKNGNKTKKDGHYTNGDVNLSEKKNTKTVNEINVKDFIKSNLQINDKLVLKYYSIKQSQNNPVIETINNKTIHFYTIGHHVQGDVDLFAKFYNDKSWTLIYTMEGDH
jgi:hypothetical protein